MTFNMHIFTKALVLRHILKSDTNAASAIFVLLCCFLLVSSIEIMFCFF